MQKSERRLGAEVVSALKRLGALGSGTLMSNAVVLLTQAIALRLLGHLGATEVAGYSLGVAVHEMLMWVACGREGTRGA